MMPSTLIVFSLLALLVPAHAADTRAPAPPRSTVPPPPPPPENYQPPRRVIDGSDLEPEVTIQTRGTEVHEEYRFNGQLYMVKVTPTRGPAYYLIYDERGQSRRSDLEPEFNVPTWVIRRF